MRPTADRLAELIADARSVVALTGAGVSVPSGIPDFRTPMTGVWATIDPVEVAHADVLRRDPRRFWEFYGQRFHTLDDASPNPAHRALVTLERAGLLDAVITQNIDRLHAAAGTEQLIEVHGSIARSRCLECDASIGLPDVRRRLACDPEGIPRCDCGGMLRPGVVLFGELLPSEAFARAERLAREADLLICIGTSLEVHPVAGLPELTLAAGGRIAIMTGRPTPLDGAASVRLAGDVVDELGAVLAALGLVAPVAGAAGG